MLIEIHVTIDKERKLLDDVMKINGNDHQWSLDASLQFLWEDLRYQRQFPTSR